MQLGKAMGPPPDRLIVRRAPGTWRGLAFDPATNTSYTVAMKRPQERLSRWMPSSNGFLCVVVILLSFLALSYSVHRSFDHDEFEHIHSAWYVANGYTPYADFFENHHPLLWYCLAPVLLVLGYSTQTVVVLRIAMFGLTMGIAFLTFLIARRVTSSATASLLSVLLLLSMVMFLEKSVEIRPDVPQVLLGVVSVYFLVCFLQTREDKHLVLAGLTASFSFLFLQKTIWLLAAYAVILCWGLIRRAISFKSVLCFAVSLSVPILLFMGWLLVSDSFKDYVLTNWVLHTSQLRPFSPLRYPLRSFSTQNALFWLLAPISVGFVLFSRKTDKALKAIGFLGIALLLSVVFLKRPHRQNYLFSIPLLCICMAYILERASVRFRLRGLYTALLLVVVLIQPLSFLVPRSIKSGLRGQQLSKVEFVIDNTTDSDLVYDGNVQFNLYRPDLHYFWFSVGEGKGLDTYSSLTDSKYGDYDGCQLIQSKRPKFISNYELDITACGLRALYDETQYDGLYMLRELEGREQPLWRDFGGVAALVGYDIEEVSGDGEHRARVSLWWRMLARTDRDYTVFIHVGGPDDTIFAQADTLLHIEGRPTSTWKPGVQGMVEYELSLPADALSERYSVTVGLYYWETGERLPAWDEFGQRVVNDAILLSP